MSTEEIEPGAVNADRTKCRCDCCQEVLDLDPLWTKDSSCPKCKESLFTWSCNACFMAYVSHSQNGDPPFPDYPCDGCGKTMAELEKEDKDCQARNAEAERIANAVDYRKSVQNGQHQSKINHTATSLQTRNSADAFNPRNLADALRIHEITWNENIRPLVIAELARRGLDESALSPTWGQRVITFFERAWLEDNAESLYCGVESNRTGGLYFFYSHLSVNLRSLREGFSECSDIFPIIPKVSIDEEEETWQATWEPDPPQGSDPREIYTTDGEKELNLYEFVLWCIRLGYAMEGDYNPECYVDTTETCMSEPISYVPVDWVGRPRKWEKEKANRFWRFFWMDPPVYQWDGTRIPDSQLEQMSLSRMQHCCVCYGSPPEGQELLVCECDECLYCSQACKEKYMKVHKYNPTVKHPQALKVCSNCGDEKTGLKRCSKCKNAFFCDEQCQKIGWNEHKKHCLRV